MPALFYKFQDQEHRFPLKDLTTIGRGRDNDLCVPCDSISGLHAVIEDVVVDESARGHGVGAALVSEAVRLAREWGALHVNLTSRSSREAANRLYTRAGFVKRETNVYSKGDKADHYAGKARDPQSQVAGGGRQMLVEQHGPDCDDVRGGRDDVHR